jgi:hypothetical protein
MKSSYRVVSEVRSNGQWVDIPDAARNVTVEPLSEKGRVRITYLKPAENVSVGEQEDTSSRQTYVD